MQAYLNFFDKLDKLIAGASREKLIALGLFVSNGLYPDYISFARKNKLGNPDLLKEALAFCETATKGVDEKTLASLIAKLEPLIPDTDNFVEAEESYAMNAAGAVYELLFYLRDGNPKHISDTCSYMIDTVDFKIADANPQLSDDGIYKHPHMLGVMKGMVEKMNSSEFF
jgi:uncharacterized protein YjaG (DUF416 family)